MFPTKLIETLQTCQHLTVLTGAGVSAESGIPTFRDALTGFWANYDPASLASEMGFLADPAFVWGWYEWRRQRVLQALPNPAHIALADLATKIPKLTLITQNVDDLHEWAGSTEVIHLHGSLHQPRCISCEEPYVLPETQDPDNPMPLTEQRIAPPRCPCCNGTIRPGVVWFGEALPVAAWEQALAASLACDLFLLVGTSGAIWPAANLPYKASQKNTPVIQINAESTDFDLVATYNLTGKAGVILPRLYAAAFGDE
jgi:NAD-dependent deacetylase